SIKDQYLPLPSGCNIKLDKKSQEHVLTNLRNAIPANQRALCEELRRMAAARMPITVGSFLQETGLDLDELYRGRRSLSKLKRAALITTNEAEDASRIASFIHVDDERRILSYKSALTRSAPSEVYEKMLGYGL